MRVFVTGATGHIGSAVSPELLAAGHEVVGLARSQESADALSAAGAAAHRGDLDDLDSLRAGAAAADGVIHLAYMHNAPAHVDAAAADLRAIEAIGQSLEQSQKPFVVTSGTLVLTPGRVGTEADPPDTAAPAAGRGVAENTALALAQRGIRSSVVRLPPTVHSSLDHHGFIPRLIEIALDKGTSAYIADGTNRWPAVHTLDAARLFRLALEDAPAGSRWHAAADQALPFREIADTIGRMLNVPARGIPQEQAEEQFGWLSFAVFADNPTSSTRTRQALAWTPEHPGQIQDLQENHYFDPHRATRSGSRSQVTAMPAS
jgi:nucleoside-diphosphate-sugar epimerase